MIIRNSAKCLECNTEIESKHRHDYVTCACSKVHVDGGTDYIKRGVAADAKWEDTSIARNAEEVLAEAIKAEKFASVPKAALSLLYSVVSEMKRLRFDLEMAEKEHR